jgi:demethylsterigmatocystin 6-O-methyltransferase
LTHFNNFMSASRRGAKTWLDAYPWRERTQGVAADQALFVDIGGGRGQQCEALRAALPDLPNRVILQDLPTTIAQAPKHAGVEAMEQDFFHPQQVRGARIYYLRNVLHDWPDDKAAHILQNTRQAMGPDSVLLIDEHVLPDRGVPWVTAQLDIVMLVLLAALERTRSQWMQLISKAGFKVTNVYSYSTGSTDGVIECVPS